ncbi:hypothetical protein ISCGN_023276 [Ixodes scapularis]
MKRSLRLTTFQDSCMAFTTQRKRRKERDRFDYLCPSRPSFEKAESIMGVTRVGTCRYRVHVSAAEESRDTPPLLTNIREGPRGAQVPPGSAGSAFGIGLSAGHGDAFPRGVYVRHSNRRRCAPRMCLKKLNNGECFCWESSYRRGFAAAPSLVCTYVVAR